MNYLHPLLLATGLFLYGLEGRAQKGNTKQMTYPHTKTTAQTDDFFGTQVPDPYRWLEDDNSAETSRWVTQQNKVTHGFLQQIPYRSALKNRITELMNYEKFSLPERAGAYLYYYKNDGLQNQSVLYRQTEGQVPELFLDPNTFSPDGTTSLADVSFSKDGSLAACKISEGGSDWQQVVILDTRTRQQVGDTLFDVKFSSLAWKGNDGLFYSSYDKPTGGNTLTAKTEHHKLYYHQLGTPQIRDKRVFGGADMPRRYVFGMISEDEQTLLIAAQENTYGNELYLLDLSQENAAPIPMVTGFNNEHGLLYASGNDIYLVTDRNAPNRKVVHVDKRNPQADHWKDIIPESNAPLDASACGRKIFATYLRDAVSEVIQFDLLGNKESIVTLPGLGTAAGFSGKEDQKETYFVFTSYTYPSTIFRYDLERRTSEPYRKPNIKFDPEQFESRQVFYHSKDGTKVPMIITYRKGMSRNGQNPLLLYGYGGFNVSVTPAFSISNIVFMENGGILAVPNIRGGGEYGKQWHTAGTRLQKQNVFDDFITAAEYLIREKYTASSHLAISGGSNGGLLVGACMAQRPELFRVAFPAVGVLDMLRYHKFTAGAGWANDYGTAEDNKEMFDYLYQYSPVHNLKKGACYPATLVTTADHDDRVVPAHSFKFAAALQAAQGCANPVLINIQVKAGHGAGKPLSLVIEEAADKWAFMFYNMNWTPKGVPAKKPM